MTDAPKRSMLRRLAADYGMAGVLLLLCIYYSIATWNEQFPAGAEAAERVAEAVSAETAFVVAETGAEAREFADRAAELLRARGVEVLGVFAGEPPGLRDAVAAATAGGRRIGAFAATYQAGRWRVLRSIVQDTPSAAAAAVVSAGSYWWPDFLKRSNLMTVADRIVVIAIIAIGMTMVIITAGIDLSVGSLIALSAVLSTLLIRDVGGAESATPAAMVLCCLAATVACGLVGVFSGLMVTAFAIPPFIVTLAMMLVAKGIAFILAAGQSIHRVPPSIDWLGRGAHLFGIPNTVVLMALLYAAAHVVMTRTVLGRYVYAVGGNREAARLSGVPVRRVLLLVYAVCGALAGLGGVVRASQLRTGAPTYGLTYELYVIAAVVVGGTSLAGGQGRVLGTLIGAFIIAVIENGMNLTGVQSYTQMVVLGLVILAAVLLDMLKKGRWHRVLARLRRGG